MKKRIRAVSGGCLGKGTKVLMYDLTYKNVEDVVVGDVLMGPDSKPRNVLELYRGNSDMYKVHQAKGIDYIVNDKHILVLEQKSKEIRATVDGKRQYVGKSREEGLFKVVAEDFYKASRRSSERAYKGIKTGLDFKYKEVNLDPYYLGLWLGDGTSRTCAITNVDPEIEAYIYNEIPKMYDVSIRKHEMTFHIKKNEGKYNDIQQRLKSYDLPLNKHIPKEYLLNSKEVRLQLLAGLIDSDGCLAKDYKTKQPKGYYITQKNKKLAEDIAMLSRSLGYYTTIKERTSTMRRKDGSYYQCQTHTVAIFAKDYNEIPVKVERKKCTMVNYKNPLASSIKLEHLGKGDYYGFELDGDHLFLLEDFTITHNTSASKSISILLYLIAMAQNDKVPTLTSIVSESFPHLKKGVMRDFLNIMQEHGYFKDHLWNKTDYTYTFETGSKLEFFSVDVPSKVRGPRRDRLFINEANNVRYEAFDQLEIRTKEFIFLDWNPVNEFWFYTDIQHREDCEHLTLTYLDNDALDPRIVASIESRKGNTNWWRVYGLGLLGELEGKVYDNWRIVDEIPHEARLERYGLDFGYSQDPTACVAIYYINGGYILDEILYKKEMSNREIGDTLINLPPALIVADCAEPKSIADLKEYGLNVIPCTKGKDSIINGIQHVQSQRISVTKRSLNLIKEYRSYMWKVDKNGRKLNVPEDDWNHLMDGLRYAMTSFKSQPLSDPYEELLIEVARDHALSSQEADYGL